MERIVRALRDAILPDDSGALNYHLFDGDATPIEEAVLCTQMSPFLAERRFILYKNAQFLSTKNVGKVSHQVDRLVEYAQTPTDSAVLVCIVNADKLDERKKATKTLLQHAKVEGFLPLKEAECRRFVMEEAKQLGVQIEPSAVNALLECAGTRLTILVQEMQKLALYVGETKTILESHVAELTTRSTEQNVFAFVDRVVRMQMDEAIEQFRELLRQKEAPVYLLFMIGRQYRMMYHMKSLLVAGVAPATCATRLSIHPYAAKVAGEQSGKYTEIQLSRILEELADTDYRIKSGQLADVLAVERFLLTLPTFLRMGRDVWAR